MQFNKKHIAFFQKHSIMLLLILFSIIQSCEKNGFYPGGDEITREIIITEDYEMTEIDKIFDITLIDDTITKAIVTCGENIQKYVDIGVKGDNALHLNHNTKTNWAREYKKIKIELHLHKGVRIDFNQPVKLSTKDTLHHNLYLVNWSGVAEVDITMDLKSFILNVGSKDFGYYIFRGKTDYSNYWIGGGSCYVKAENLISKTCSITNRSIGDMYLNVTERLDAAIDFTGNIYYKGNPKEVVLDHQYSTGKLIHYD